MMSSLSPNLERIGRELDSAWRPTRTSTRRRASVLAVAVCGVLVFALVATVRLDEAGRPTVSPLERALAALVVPKEGVFHVRIEFRENGRTTHVNEIWQSAARWRSTNTGQPESGGRADGTREFYDAATQTIYAYRDTSAPPPLPLADAYTTDMRRLLSRPDAEVSGTDTIEGIECVRIDSRRVRGTLSSFYVDADSFRPVLERRVSATGTAEVWFRIWEVRPEDSDSSRVTSLQLQYPRARLVTGIEEFGAAWARIRGLPAPPQGGLPEPPPPPAQATSKNSNQNEFSSRR